MQLNELQREHKNATKKRIGRGGTRGKTSGRGHKGQKQHGGHGIRPEIRDMIKKLPKLRGYRFNSYKPKAVPVNLSTIEEKFEAGETVSPATLKDKKIIATMKGKPKDVKILGTGELSKKVTVEGCKVSTSAKEAIEKAGGKVVEA